MCFEMRQCRSDILRKTFYLDFPSWELRASADYCGVPFFLNSMPSLKGKAKAVVRDDPGGSTAGVVLPLNIAGSGIYDVYALIMSLLGMSD